MSEQVTVHVEAPVDRVWGLVSDITRMGEWSPEVYEAEWADGATGPAVGARFKARNRRFGFLKYGNTSLVVVAEPGQEFAFVQGRADKFRMKWTYRLESSGSGTDLTESWESGMPGVATMAALPPKRRRNLAVGMQHTLDRIKAAAESAT